LTKRLIATLGVLLCASSALAQSTDPLKAFETGARYELDWKGIETSGILDRSPALAFEADRLERAINVASMVESDMRLNLGKDAEELRTLQRVVRRLREVRADGQRARGEAVDLLASYRLVNGDVDWQRVAKARPFSGKLGEVLKPSVLNRLRADAKEHAGKFERAGNAEFAEALRLEAKALGKSAVMAEDRAWRSSEVRDAHSMWRGNLDADGGVDWKKVAEGRLLDGLKPMDISTHRTIVPMRMAIARYEELAKEAIDGRGDGKELASLEESIRRLRWLQENNVRDADGFEARTDFEEQSRRMVEAIRAAEGKGKTGKVAFRAQERVSYLGSDFPGWIPESTVERAFESVRKAALEGVTDPAQREALNRIRIVSHPGLVAPAHYTGAKADGENPANRLVVSDALLEALFAESQKLPPAEREAFIRQSVGMLAARTFSHLGAKGTPAELVERGLGSDFDARVASGMTKTKIELFETGGRIPALNATAEDVRAAKPAPVEDPFSSFRSRDGSIDWTAVKRARRGAVAGKVGAEVGKLGHFGLALFLKELAIVAGTGDRLRLEEFFEGLLTTDFYTHYGLFVLGARAGDIAYAKTLQRYIKPRFISGVLRSNVALAAGLALPQWASGNLDGHSFAISFASLGISSTAVKGAAGGIKWLVNLKKARQTGALAKTGLAASRFAKVGGWFYTVAELAVVLYVADDLDAMIRGHLDRKAARAELAKAGLALSDALADPNGDAAKAAADYHEAWGAYRRFLYASLYEDEALLASRLAKAARDAKLVTDQREHATSRLTEGLKASVAKRYGSLEAYAEHLSKDADDAVRKRIEQALTAYARDRDAHLRELYGDNVRAGRLLDGVEGAEWVLGGAQPNAQGDLYADASLPLYARQGRRRLRDKLSDALSDASLNRLQTYRDERDVLVAAESALKAAGRNEHADALGETLALIRRESDMDLDLARDHKLLSEDAKGLVEALKTR
jgi:hypothetical protein